MGPSPIAAAGDTHTPRGRKEYVRPREMTRQDIVNTIDEYARAAERAVRAGFDAVEIHAANGYLLDQFIRDGSNHRADEYGGKVQNRIRLLLDVTEAVARCVPASRVGVRLSPTNPYNDMRDSDPVATFVQAAKALSRLGLAYLHVVEPVSQDQAQLRVSPKMRSQFDGRMILNGGYDAATGAAALRAGEAEMIAYGRHFLANPDLVERFRHSKALNRPDASTFYTDGPKGYTDYRLLDSGPAK